MGMTRKYLAIFVAVAALATGCATKKTPTPQLGGVTRAANAAGDAVAGATASSEEVKKFHWSSAQLVDRLDNQVKALLK
jgi:hypothetical protein